MTRELNKLGFETPEEKINIFEEKRDKLLETLLDNDETLSLEEKQELHQDLGRMTVYVEGAKRYAKERKEVEEKELKKIKLTSELEETYSVIKFLNMFDRVFKPFFDFHPQNKEGDSYLDIHVSNPSFRAIEYEYKEKVEEIKKELKEL